MSDIVLGTGDKMMHEKDTLIALRGLVDGQSTNRYLKNSVIRTSDQTRLPERRPVQAEPEK